MYNAYMATFTDQLADKISVGNTRLILRRFREEDADVLFQLATEPLVARYVPWAKAIKDIDSSKRMIKSFDGQWEDGLFARFLICKDDRPCGYIGIWRHSKDKSFEIGFAILPEYRGQGIVGTVLQCVERLLHEKLDANLVVAHVDEENESSKRALTKNGYQETDSFNEEGERLYEKTPLKR